MKLRMTRDTGVRVHNVSMLKSLRIMPKVKMSKLNLSQKGSCFGICFSVTFAPWAKGFCGTNVTFGSPGR